MKILVAEDDQLMVKMLEFRLKKDGHDVVISHDDSPQGLIRV